MVFVSSLIHVTDLIDQIELLGEKAIKPFLVQRKCVIRSAKATFSGRGWGWWTKTNQNKNSKEELTHFRILWVASGDVI